MSSLIETGAGTGWTLNMGVLKLSSMRGHLLLFFEFLIVIIIISRLLNLLYYVKTSRFMRLHAWLFFENKIKKSHQRLNRKQLNKYTYQCFYSITSNPNLNIASGLHLNSKNENKPDFFPYPNSNDHQWFEQWLVGFVDGDGTFSIVQQNNKWSLCFKVAQNEYNIRALIYIKKNLGVGKITRDGKQCQILIRNKEHLKTYILPIFRKYPLLTSKYFNYLKFEEALAILDDPYMSKQEKDKRLWNLKHKQINEEYVSPAWNLKSGLLFKESKYIQLNSDHLSLITKPWLVGFIEAEGSFCLIKKSPIRIVHCFAISQKLDLILLVGIKKMFHIPSQIQKLVNGSYALHTTNSRCVEDIIQYFDKSFKGIKSFEYKLWTRSYFKHKGDFSKLEYIRNLVRKIKARYSEKT